MKYKFILLVVCFLSLLMSCSDPVREMPSQDYMKALLEGHPDSLATLLEEINPMLLSDADKAEYGFWITKTHNKQRRSLINDTLIHYTLDYYRNVNSPRLVETCFLAAKQVNWSMSYPSKTMKLLNEAMQLADAKSDTAMINMMIPYILYAYEVPRDKKKIDELAQFTRKYTRPGGNITSYFNMVRIFSKMNQTDSVFKYSALGIELARGTDNNEGFALERTYINALNKSGRSREAMIALKSLEKRYYHKNEIMLSYIPTWIGVGQLDSAQVCIDYFQPLLDKYKGVEEVELIRYFLHTYQLVISTKRGETLDITNIGRTADNLLQMNFNTIKVDRERQFIQNKLIRDNLLLDIERGKLRQRFLWAGIFVLIIFAFLIFIYQRKLLRKERSMQKAREQLRIHALQLTENENIIHKNEELIQTLSTQLDESDDLKQEIDQLSAENDILKHSNKTLQKDIEKYSNFMEQKDQEFDTYKRLAEENARLQERERFLTTQVIAHTEVLISLSKKPHYIDEMQWAEIFNAINQLFDGFSYRLHTDFPALTQEDIRYCCLIKMRLTTSVISTLMGVSPSSVTKRKQRIKEKMSQQHIRRAIHKEQALEIYLWNY